VVVAVEWPTWNNGKARGYGNRHAAPWQPVPQCASGRASGARLATSALRQRS